jgi:hypothetical protein
VRGTLETPLLSLHECAILPGWTNDPVSPSHDPAFGQIPPLGYCYDNTWTVTVE